LTGTNKHLCTVSFSEDGVNLELVQDSLPMAKTG
jgi:hypothetical protein